MILAKKQSLGNYGYHLGQRIGMGSRQKAKSQRIAAKSCDNCVHKSVCILYHGHGQLELRFGNSYAKDPDAFISKLDEQLAQQCRFYLQAKQKAPTSSHHPNNPGAYDEP